MATSRVLGALLFCASFLAFATRSSPTLECRQNSGNCINCLADPSCGYCASSQACVPGNETGPTAGSCPQWDFNSCPTPAPISLPKPWKTFGGDDSRRGFIDVSLPSVPLMAFKWSQPNSPPTGSAVTSRKYVWFVQTTNDSLMLTVRSKLTGALVKNIPLGATSGYSTPYIHEAADTVVVQINEPNEGTLISAFSMTTFESKWNVSGASQWPLLPFGLAGIDDIIFAPVGSQTSEIVAINVSNGITLWTASGYNADGGCDSWGPTIHNNQVLWNKETGESNPTMVGGLSVTSSEPLWNYSWAEAWQGYSAHWYTVSATSDIVLASPWGSGVVQYTALNVSESPAKVMWSQNCSYTYNSNVPMASDGEFAFAVCNGSVMSLHLQTGALGTNYHCPVACVAPVVVTNTHVIALSSGSCVYAFRKGVSQAASAYCSNVTSTQYVAAAIDSETLTLLVNGYPNMIAIDLSA